MAGVGRLLAGRVVVYHARVRPRNPVGEVEIMACVMIGMNSVLWGYGISWLMSLPPRLKASFLRRSQGVTC